MYECRNPVKFARLASTTIRSKCFTIVRHTLTTLHEIRFSFFPSKNDFKNVWKITK